MRASYEAIQDQADSQKQALLPKLTIEGIDYYQTTVTSFKVGLKTVTLGDHNNYSVGPVLTATLFDSSQLTKSLQSTLALANSKHEDLQFGTMQLLLNVRLAYFRTQQDLETLLFTGNALKLAQAQEKDISKRFAAGSILWPFAKVDPPP